MRLTIILVCALFIATANAQSSSRFNDPDTTVSSSYARVSLRYKSNYYYMGRADSARVPYLVPSFAYYHKSGFSINSSVSYLTAEDQGRVDMFTVGIGFDYFGKKIATGASLDEYFFNDLSYAVQAEMRTYLSGYIGYDLDLFLVIVDASLGISQNTDVFLGGEVSHLSTCFGINLPSRLPSTLTLAHSTTITNTIVNEARQQARGKKEKEWEDQEEPLRQP